MSYYKDIAHSNGDGFIMTSTLTQKWDLGTKKAEARGTDWVGGSLAVRLGFRKQEAETDEDFHEENNKQPAGRKDVEREGRSELV